MGDRVVDPRLGEDVFWPRLQAALGRVTPEQRTPPADARVAAVLVLLEQTPAGPRVILTRRRRDLRSHPGQVSFAGGRLDDGETVEEAALREAEEEIGLDPATVAVLGVGPVFYLPPSRFWVAPVVGRWSAPHELQVNPWEVDEVLAVPLASLLERDRWRKVPLSIGGASWAWALDDDLLWGATAMVVALLLDVSVEDWSGGTTPDDLTDDVEVRPWEDMPRWRRGARLAGVPERSQADVPHVTAATRRDVVRRVVDAGVGVDVLAEHAGRALVSASRRLVDGSLAGVAVTVAVGPGGTGAGGLAAARLLASAGARVTAVCAGQVRVPAAVESARGTGVRIVDVGDAPLDALLPGDVVLDALLGIGADPPLRGEPERVAAWLRRHDVPVIALDLPSGVGADLGLRGMCVTADITVATGLPVAALRERIVQPYAGDLYVADVGVPPAHWHAVGVDIPEDLFADGPLVRLTAGDVPSDAGTPDQAELP